MARCDMFAQLSPFLDGHDMLQDHAFNDVPHPTLRFSVPDIFEPFKLQQEDLPENEFECPNDGMLWHKEVLQRVPVKWADMLHSKDFLATNEPTILNEGARINSCNVFFSKTERLGIPSGNLRWLYVAMVALEKQAFFIG